MRISTKELILVAMFAAVTCVGGLMLRFGGETVVPFSILPLIVMLAGALLGGKLGALSMVLYLIMGLMGLPVFAKPPYGGPTYILQPTFGFLLGFIPAAYAIGRLLERKEKPSLGFYFSSMVVGIILIYLIGLPYLYLILNFYVGKALSILAVVKIGFLPFILFDLMKAVVAVLVAKPVAERVKSA